jgi:predicted nucleotidyltransferase
MNEPTNNPENRWSWSYKAGFERILRALTPACHVYYGERLVSLAVFGSVARGLMRPDSDIDILLVADPLPRGRMRRIEEFGRVEDALGERLRDAAQAGIQTTLSPVIKTPAEVEYGSFLFLDMTDQARILYDQDGFLRSYLDGLSERLKAMGAKRVYSKGAYYWVLKPGLKPGEDIVL